MMPEEVLKRAKAKKFGDRFMMNLAGNAFTGTVFMAALISAMACAPIVQQQHAEADLASADAIADGVGSIMGFA